MSGLILALDLGTSSTRALLYRADDGTMVPGSLFDLDHEPDATPDGGATLDADALVEETVTCAAKALAVAQEPILAVALCTFWHSFLGVGADGKARTPISLWSDRRSASQVARLREILDPDTCLQRTGCPSHTSYPPGRLLWLRETDPHTFADCARFISPGEYLFQRLFGPDTSGCSTSMASASGLYDQTIGQWDHEVLGALGLEPERLSTVSEAPMTGLREPYRSRLAAVADVPWFPALGDGACSNLGCGATGPERLALMVGTSGALRVATPDRTTPPTVPPGLWRYQSGPGDFLLGGALSNGGAVWAYLKKIIRTSESDDALEAAIDALPPDSHGLTVLPFLAGERAPLWRDDLRATIHGLSMATTGEEIVRAHLEAVALRFRALRTALRPVAPSAEIIGTGAGLLASEVWAKMIADALGEPLVLSSEAQASSRGAALVARERLGLGTVRVAPLPAVTRTIVPTPAHTEIYSRAAERQETLLKTLWN